MYGSKMNYSVTIRMFRGSMKDCDSTLIVVHWVSPKLLDLSRRMSFSNVDAAKLA